MCTFIKKKDGKIFLTHLIILLVTSNMGVFNRWNGTMEWKMEWNI